MSNLDATDSGEPPYPPPPYFSRLPEDLNIEILARVPRCHYPIVSRVSKYFANRVHSPDLQKKRSLWDLDSLYLFFLDRSINPRTLRWFTLRNNPTERHFTSIDSLPSPSFTDIYPSILATGPEMFFFGESSTCSSRFCIFDSRSSEFREGPSMLMERRYKSVGRVDDKIYVIGGRKYLDEIPAESFDLKKQIWEIAPVPKAKRALNRTSWATASLGRKVYSFSFHRDMTSYDTRDGSCESFEMPEGQWGLGSVCVIENVLYAYNSYSGLMWFDTMGKIWRAVDGLHLPVNALNVCESVGTGEYYGKMAFLWVTHADVQTATREIWCRMIALDKNGVGIRGTAEPSQLLGIVPDSYGLQQCLSVSKLKSRVK